jgi:hypothetical protein
MDSAFLGNRACKCSVNIIAADGEGSPSEIDETVPFQRANGVVSSSETAEIEIAVAENFHPRRAAARGREENAPSRAGITSASIGN